MRGERMTAEGLERARREKAQRLRRLNRRWVNPWLRLQNRITNRGIMLGTKPGCEGQGTSISVFLQDHLRNRLTPDNAARVEKLILRFRIDLLEALR
jgi:hypothetical protein